MAKVVRYLGEVVNHNVTHRFIFETSGIYLDISLAALTAFEYVYLDRQLGISGI